MKSVKGRAVLWQTCRKPSACCPVTLRLEMDTLVFRNGKNGTEAVACPA